MTPKEKFGIFSKGKLERRHDGFSLNNIPRIKSENKFLKTTSKFSSTKNYCKKMINSLKLGSNLNIKGEIYVPRKAELRKIDKIKNENEYVERLCNLQNQKFGKIFTLQMDSKILEENCLPKITNEIKEIELSKNFYNNGNSKYMGSKYNPYNYDLFASKNRIKRNVFGTLFIN